MAVEVGLVVGRMAATTPTGTPISTIFSSGISRRMPMVFMPRMRRGSQSQHRIFLMYLSLALPYPVSSTASSASLRALARAAAAIRSTTASTCSWEKARYFSQAAYALSTLVRTSWMERRSLSSSIDCFRGRDRQGRRPGSGLLEAYGEDFLDFLVGP